MTMSKITTAIKTLKRLKQLDSHPPPQRNQMSQEKRGKVDKVRET